MFRVFLGTVAAWLLGVQLAFAQGTVILVRHAERADARAGARPTMDTDPDLSDAGRQRAESLAAILKDAGITAVFVTEYKRTQQTAAPLAQLLGLTPVSIAAKDVLALVARLEQTHGNALVVGHSNTVPEVITALGVTKNVTIAEDEYDSLFVVSPASSRQVMRLRFR